jgi:hypothetical protein
MGATKSSFAGSAGAETLNPKPQVVTLTQTHRSTRPFFAPPPPPPSLPPSLSPSLSLSLILIEMRQACMENGRGDSGGGTRIGAAIARNASTVDRDRGDFLHQFLVNTCSKDIVKTNSKHM